MTQSIQNNEKIAKSFPHLNYSGDNENYGTMSKTKKILDIPCFTTDFYGTSSIKHNEIVGWNHLVSAEKKTYSKIKSI